MFGLDSASDRKPLNWRALAAAFLVPLLFAAGFLAATWKSEDNLKRVEAAVVNLDEPVTINGQMVPLGRQLAGGLVTGDEDDPDKNFTWKLTDEDDARSGLASGRYAALVVIPEDFSAAATSYGKDDPQDARQATLEVRTSTITGIADASVGQTIADTATRTLNTTLTETYLDNIYLGFNEQGKQMQTVADGAGKLADGSEELGKGIDEAAKGADEFSDGLGQLDDGASQLADNSTKIKSGGTELAGGVRKLADQTSALPEQAGKLAEGSRGIADGTKGLSEGTSGLATGASKLSSGAGQLSGGASQLSSGLEQMNEKMPELKQGAAATKKGAQEYAAGAEQYADGAEKYGQGVKQFSTGLKTGMMIPCPAEFEGDPKACAGFAAGQKAAGAAMEAEDPQTGQSLVGGAKALGDGGKELGGGATELAGGVEQFATGIDQLATGVSGLSDGAKKLATGVDGIAGGADELAKGAKKLDAGTGQLADGADKVATGNEQLAEGMVPLSKGISDLSTGVGEYTDGVGQYADGVVKLSDGIGQAADGGSELADGLHKLSDGQGELSKGQRELADGLKKGASQVPSYNASDRENLKTVVAAPVASQDADEATVLPALSSTSLLMIVALWLGGLATYLVVRAIPTRSLTSSEPSWRLTLSSLLPGVVMAVGQGIVVSLLANLVLELNVPKLFAVLAVAIFGAITFAVVNHALVAWLGGVGRLISVAFVVLTAASGVISAIPAFFDAVRPINPITPALDAVRSVASDGPGLGGSLGLLAAWLVVALVASQLAVVRRRMISPDQLARAVPAT
ncbi:YhgE/Pip family protein [Propionibacteriaceae bacterium Y1700]|uniref:YhgE/Pip domain-containing protein n=1 Tax=Microlunatus sp. Y1700 TaxID=3418487 RepID=UPI003DA71107